MVTTNLTLRTGSGITVTVEYRGRGAEVNSPLRSFQLAMWASWIWCEVEVPHNQAERVHIRFDTSEDAQAFLNRVAVPPRREDIRVVDGFPYVGDTMVEDTLYGHAMQICGGDSDWEYTCDPINHALDTEVVDGHSVTTRQGPPDFRFGVGISIPGSDLPGIIDRLVTALAS